MQGKVQEELKGLTVPLFTSDSCFSFFLQHTAAELVSMRPEN